MLTVLIQQQFQQHECDIYRRMAMVEAPNTVVPSGNETMNSASTDAYNAEDYE